MKKHTVNFLEAVLFGYREPSHVEGKTVYDFHPDFIGAAESFIGGFVAFLAARNVEPVETTRSFGGNCYWSLSGHGVGFRSDDETKHLQRLLEEYSGDKYRFEQLDLSAHRRGKLDLSFVVSALPKYRDCMFKEGLAKY